MMPRVFLFQHTLCALWVASCVACAQLDGPRVEATPQAARSQTLRALQALERGAEPPPEPGSALVPESWDWSQIRARVLEGHPQWLAADLEARALALEVQQATLRPSPIVGLDVEDFGGRGARSGLDGAQETLWVEQTFEARGKREARVRLAEANQEFQQREAEASLQAIVGEVREAYILVLASEKTLAVAAELEGLVEGFYVTVQGRVRAGKASALDESQYKVSMSGARLDRQRAQRAVDAARLRLSQALGGSKVPATLQGELVEPEVLPKLVELWGRLERSNAWERVWAAEQKARAQNQQEMSSMLADWQWTLGFRHFEDSDDYAATIGVAVPWQLAKARRLRGAAAEARAQAGAAQRTLEQRALRDRLASEHARMGTSLEVLHTLRGELEQEAEWVYRSMLGGYEQGRFDLVAVLAAQKNYFDLRATRAWALGEYHGAWARAQTLLGETWK